MPKRLKLAIVLAYRGTTFHGVQRLPDFPSAWRWGGVSWPRPVVDCPHPPIAAVEGEVYKALISLGLFSDSDPRFSVAWSRSSRTDRGVRGPPHTAALLDTPA